MKKNSTIILISFLINICLLTSCLPKVIVDDVNLIQGVVLDRVQNKFKTTIVCSLNNKSHTLQLFENSGNTIKMGRILSSLESEKKFEIGKLRVFFATTKLVKKDITQLYECLSRDNKIGHTLYLGILDSEVKKIFSQKPVGHDNKVIYIKKMLEHNMKTGIVPTDNLHNNMYRYYGEGQDTFLPIIKINDDKIQITGLGLFNKKKYVGKLTLQEMYIFKGLIEKHTLGAYQFKIKNGYTIVTHIHSIPSYSILMKGGQPTFNITVKLDASLQEVSKNIKLNEKQNIQQIEKFIEKELQLSSENLIKKLKKLNVDPLGLGAKFKTKSKYWNAKKWESLYSTIPIHVEYKMNIINSGSME